jgi:hypothetical protein
VLSILVGHKTIELLTVKVGDFYCDKIDKFNTVVVDVTDVVVAVAVLENWLLCYPLPLILNCRGPL